MKEITLTLTSKHLADIFDSVLPTMKKAERAKITKAAIKNALLRQPKATVVKTRSISQFTLALESFKTNLKDAGYTGKGAPTSAMRQSALDRLTTGELKVLGFGTSTKFCKTAPVFHAVTLQKNIADLRA